MCGFGELEVSLELTKVDRFWGMDVFMSSCAPDLQAFGSCCFMYAVVETVEKVSVLFSHLQKCPKPIHLSLSLLSREEL